jgi:hypothetical protein
MATIGMSIRPNVRAAAPDSSRQNLPIRPGRSPRAFLGNAADPLRVCPAARVYDADIGSSLREFIGMIGNLGSISCVPVKNVA